MMVGRAMTRISWDSASNLETNDLMKRLAAMLSGAFLVLGEAYVLWMERRRLRQAEDRSTDIERWESEGGNPRGDPPRTIPRAGPYTTYGEAETPSGTPRGRLCRSASSAMRPPGSV